MRQHITFYCLLAAALSLQAADASIDRFLLRRQATEAPRSEQESTTPKSEQQVAAAQQQANNDNGRLYPDLPQRPNFIPPFNAPPQHVQAPFVPFGLQMPAGGPPLVLNADQQPAPFGRAPLQPRPMTPAERLQSQTFTDGLGKRLLSMIGIHMGNQTGAAEGADLTSAQNPGLQVNPAMRALQNATVLDKLNHRLSALMGGLSKMYNSTVHEQMGLLNDRFKETSENSTNPWQQRMAQQVPAFFKQMASRVGDAQEQLNRVMRDVLHAAQGNSSHLNRSSGTQPSSFFGSFDQFMDPAGGFFGAAGSPVAPNQQGQQQPDMAAKLREFWQVQVQPRVGMLRNQMSRVWRDLTTSGALAPESVMRTRSNQNNVNAGNNQSNARSSGDLVDSILKEIDADTGSEYTLVDPKGEPATSTAESRDSLAAQDDAPADGQKPRVGANGGNQMNSMLSPQMQNRLVEMQRDLNQLWVGLTKSLQGALGNLKRMSQAIRPGQQDAREADPRQNEIDDKISELTKLQREADTVQQVVQQQQQQQQQRQSVGDRFRGFMNNVDINQLPDRIGEHFNRFGNAVGTFWNQIPERWDNFMARQMR